MNITGKKIIVIRILLTILTLGLVIFIFSNSFQSASVSSSSSGRVITFLNNLLKTLGFEPFFTQEIVRPLAHFCEFGLLGVLSLLTYLSYFGVKAKTMILSAATVCFVSLADECIQLFSDGRAFQFSDLVIDISGGLLGAVAVFLIALLIHNHKKKVSEKES